MTSVTPIEDSNLANIGSEEDIAVRQAAAGTEVNWEDAGTLEGIQIWRVENVTVRQNNGDNGDENEGELAVCRKFGINPWPKDRYGEFYSGDSYIILQTRKDDGTYSDGFIYDIYFWIGSESSQDEYGVAAYKSVELDDKLGSLPVQHREVQYYESDNFVGCFPQGLRYLDGGIDSGFRSVGVDSGSLDFKVPQRLYHVHKNNGVTKCTQVQASYDSLNHGDAFILDTGTVIYTWFGNSCSPFEKNKAAEVAHNLTIQRNGETIKDEDVDDDHEEFWTALGGKKDYDIKEESDFQGYSDQERIESKMYILSDVDSILHIEECPLVVSNLASDDVCLIDTGKTVFVWIGNGSSLREQSQAMLLAQRIIGSVARDKTTNIVRVLEDQADRVRGFSSAF